jgi:hypothetical protein
VRWPRTRRGRFCLWITREAALDRPGGDLRARIEAEFVQDILHVRVGGAGRYNKRRGNLPVR